MFWVAIVERERFGNVKKVCEERRLRRQKMEYLCVEGWAENLEKNGATLNLYQRLVKHGVCRQAYFLNRSGAFGQEVR
jgi:hypothetical protein